MNRKGWIILLTLLLWATLVQGCVRGTEPGPEMAETAENAVNPGTITDEQAVSAVQEAMKSDFGPVVILSITRSKGHVVVEWERKSNCEKGKSYVDDKSGVIVRGEYSIC